MNHQKQRDAAESIAREMAMEGMNEKQVRKELESLDLHHYLSPVEIHGLVSKYKPKGKVWIPDLTHFKRRTLGLIVTIGCSILFFFSFQYMGEEPDPLSGRREANRAGRGLMYSGLGVIAGLYMLLKPEDAGEDFF